MTAPEFIHSDNGTSRHRRCGSVMPTSHVTRHVCQPAADLKARKAAR